VAFLAACAQHWQHVTRTDSGTPLQEAFDRADDALAMTQLKGQVAVLVVTDGEPNCVPNPQASAMPTAPAADRAQRGLTVRAVKTYVLGLPGAAGVQLLDSIAANGGTMQYLLPDGPTALDAQLEQVVQDTILTTFRHARSRSTRSPRNPVPCNCRSWKRRVEEGTTSAKT
jgi:hypothetical protein